MSTSIVTAVPTAVPGLFRAGLLGFALLLGACVTETSGGFNVTPSETQALQDYIQLAVGYLEGGDLANARRHLNNAEAIDPDNSEVFAIWGLVHAREGETDLADASFRRSLRIDATNSQARNNYAAFLFANDRFENAYEELQRVVQDTAYSGRAQAFENLGMAALRLERMAEAEQAFNRAVQLNPNQLRSSLELASLALGRQDLLQARTLYNRYLTVLQFYNLGHNARSLWVGVQLENALGNSVGMQTLGSQLEAQFSATAEYRLYQQLRDTQKK